MPLQQPEGDGATERVDDKIYISIGTKLPASNRAPQYQTRHFSPALGELRLKGSSGIRVDLRLRN